MKSNKQCIKSKINEYNSTGETSMDGIYAPVDYTIDGIKFHVTSESVPTKRDVVRELIRNFLMGKGVIEDDATE